MTHQLIPFLKRLRLSGILETLEVRNQQAVDGRWTYVEFLARLLEDEVERRAQKQLALRIRRAAINTTKTLEGFDFNFNPSINRQQVLELATCTYIRQKRNTSDYERAGLVTEQEAEEMVALAKQLRDDVEQWLHIHHPELASET